MSISRSKTSLSKISSRMPLTLLMLMSGCATGNSSGCPMIKTYTPQQQNQAYIELSQLAPNSELRTMLDDYALLRQEARDCN
jgi:hypothetical protein